MELKERIRILRERNDMTQEDLGNKLGISLKTISSWETGRSEPRMGMIEKMSSIFGVRKSDIIGEVRSKNIIPVIGKVVAGLPIEAVQEIIDYEEISPELAKTGDFFALQINGDSMQPIIIDGDIAIVRKQSDIESGQIGIVLVNGNDATVKKIIKRETGIMLVPFNSNYEPIVYSEYEIQSIPVEIVGRVIEIRRKF
ncbi:MAG: XRE family transcriptional regulator [Erysipelotrichaceae bacterium]